MVSQVATIVDATLDARIAQRITEERRRRDWSAADLAERSGVSRAMISRIEREEAKPTASLLGKISSAFGLPLSDFFASTEAPISRISLAATREAWRDPETGYIRTPISPSGDRILQLTEVTLPAGARVRYPAGAYEFIHQQIWVMEGRLTFTEGRQQHDLSAGDCLTLGPPSDCSFANDTRKKCRYLVAVVRR